MPALLGARALGIPVQWTYGFVGHGSSATTTPGVVYLDVGNRLCAGVLDQHQDGSVGECTSDLLLSHPEYVYHHLLSEVLTLHAQGQLPPKLTLTFRIITHRDPDWDGMVSAFLVQRLIEDGELPAYAPALIAYSRQVDQGRFSVRRYLDKGEEGLRALALLPHLGALVVTHTYRNPEQALTVGMELLKATLDGLLVSIGAPWGWTQQTFETLDAPVNGAGAWAQQERFEGFPERIVADLNQWRNESADATCEDVLLPVDSADGGVYLQAVPAVILRRPSKSMLNKYWARAEGHPLFVCPYTDGNDAPLGPDAVAGRVVISLPDDVGSWPTGVKPAHLRGLGAVLEREETRLRTEIQQQRVGRPRWDDDAYCDNADPWYDGRGHAYRILDTPRAGTVQTYASLVAHIRNARFWAPLDVVLDDISFDLHVVLPDDGLRLESTEAPSLTEQGIWGPGGLSSTLRTWASHTRTHDVANALLTLLPPPPGVRVHRAVRRDITPVHRPAGRVFPRMIHVSVRRDRQATEAPRLGEVVRWLVDVERAILGNAPAESGAECAPDRAFLALSWTPSREFRGGPATLERLLRRIGATTTRPDGTRVGPRVIARERPALQTDADAAQVAPIAEAIAVDVEQNVLAEMLGYVAFLDATLSRVSEQIAMAVLTLEGAETRTHVAVADVRNEFLLFQGLYFQPEVSANPRVQQACDDVRTALQLDRHYREVESELDRLAQVETARADERMGTVMEILTLVSLVGTVDAVAQGLNEGMGEDQNWLRAVLALVTLLSVAVLRRRFRA